MILVKVEGAGVSSAKSGDTNTKKSSDKNPNTPTHFKEKEWSNMSPDKPFKRGGNTKKEISVTDSKFNNYKYRKYRSGKEIMIVAWKNDIGDVIAAFYKNLSFEDKSYKKISESYYEEIKLIDDKYTKYGSDNK